LQPNSTLKRVQTMGWRFTEIFYPGSPEFSFFIS